MRQLRAVPKHGMHDDGEPPGERDPCLSHHVGVVDETRGTYRHQATRRAPAPRTLRVATHRYATLEPLGKPGGSRAFGADAPLNRPWLRDAYRSQPEAETEEI
jgi:hypothetical protein